MRQFVSLRWYSLLVFAGVGVAGLRPAAADTILYSDNFDSYNASTTTTPTNFNPTSTSAIYLKQISSPPTQNVYESKVGNASVSSAIKLDGTLIPGGLPSQFTVSTDATYVGTTGSGTINGENFGLGLFGTSSSLSNNTEYRLLFSTNGSSGTLSLYRNGTGLTSTNGVVTSGSASVVAGDKYYLSANIQQDTVHNTLTITGTAYDYANPNAKATLTFTDSSPLTGTYFGYRTATNSSGGTQTETVDYDNFAVTTTPEPAAIGLLGIGAAGLLKRRRRA